MLAPKQDFENSFKHSKGSGICTPGKEDDKCELENDGKRSFLFFLFFFACLHLRFFLFKKRSLWDTSVPRTKLSLAHIDDAIDKAISGTAFLFLLSSIVYTGGG